jgi:hypothetical protein
MVVTSAATCGPATRCSKRMKRSGEGSRPCCPLFSCSTSLRTAGRRRGRTHPPDGRRTRLGRGGGVMADPLLSGRVPTQRSNRSQLLRSNPSPGFLGGLTGSFSWPATPAVTVLSLVHCSLLAGARESFRQTTLFRHCESRESYFAGALPLSEISMALRIGICFGESLGDFDASSIVSLSATFTP